MKTLSVREAKDQILKGVDDYDAGMLTRAALVTTIEGTLDQLLVIDGIIMDSAEDEEEYEVEFIDEEDEDNIDDDYIDDFNDERDE